MNLKQAQKSNIKVAVRVRPTNEREYDAKDQTIVRIQDKNIFVYDPESMHLKNPKARNFQTFCFDYCFDSCGFESNDPLATQASVYEELGQYILSNVQMGYNCSLLAYGQTGSGKSYSVMGTVNNEEQAGIIPRLAQDLFKKFPLYELQVSFLEIYDEKISDLLADQDNLNIREANNNPYVDKLSCHACTNFEEIKAYMDQGDRKRHTASTKMNDRSSRSHAVFTIYLKTQGKVFSKIQLVDLAGSEKVKDSGVTGIHLKEAANINKSLTILGRVIHTLSLNKKGAHVPFRDSKLTHLLKDSLGGNSKTIILAAISPSSLCHNETINTLSYASYAKKIVNQVQMNPLVALPNLEQVNKLEKQRDELLNLLKTVNETSVEYKKLLKELQETLQLLQDKIYLNTEYDTLLITALFWSEITHNLVQTVSLDQEISGHCFDPHFEATFYRYQPQTLLLKTEEPILINDEPVSTPALLQVGDTITWSDKNFQVLGY